MTNSSALRSAVGLTRLVPSLCSKQSLIARSSLRSSKNLSFKLLLPRPLGSAVIILGNKKRLMLCPWLLPNPITPVLTGLATVSAISLIALMSPDSV